MEYEVAYLDGEEEKAAFVKRAGKVRITYANGDVFTGEVNEDKRKHGQGKYEFASADEETPGSVYEGSFVDGLRTGLGTMTFSDGTVYRGEFVEGFWHGFGSYVYANQDVYSGQWSNSRRHGEGTYLFDQSQCRIEGVWADGEPVLGRFIHPDGTQYEGKFVKGRFSDAAAFTFASGLKIDGEFYALEEDGAETLRWKTTAGPATAAAI